MSCLRPSVTEPDFEPVTLFNSHYPHPQLPPQSRGQFIATTNSFPKLRLDFDDQDEHLMTEEDFEDIMQHQIDEMERAMSPTLPDPPTFPGLVGCRATTAVREGIHLGHRNEQGSSSKSDFSIDLHRRLTSLDLGSSNAAYNAIDSDDEGMHQDFTRHVGTIKGKEKARVKLRPKPISIVPREGTLTALPGSAIAGNRQSLTTAAFADGLSDGSPGPSTVRTTVQRSMPHPPLTPVTPMSAPPAPGHEGKSLKRKRKLSLSGPFSTVKRILTPKKTKITHLTHEATASNRLKDDAEPNEPSSPTTPISHSAQTIPFTPITPRPSSTVLSTPVIFTSKSTLNKTIIALRGQVSDLTLENRVLKEQVALVRKDWIDTSQDLDLERYKSWDMEMKAFKLGLLVEELRGEVTALKRGSLLG